jgi:subtilisin
MRKQISCKQLISKWTLALCWVIALVLVVNQQSVSGLAQDVAPKAGSTPEQEDGAAAKALQRARVQQKLDALLTKAKGKGAVRVIVGVHGDFKPESELPSKQAARWQRERISEAQDTFLGKLYGYASDSIKKFRSIPYLTLEVDENGLQALKQMEEVTSVVEDVEDKPLLDRSVPLINAPQAWGAGFSGQGQAVAILDSGFDLNHPFITNRIVAQACFSTTSASSGATSVCPNGLNSMIGPNAARNVESNVFGFDHGTHVAGIAAGNGTGAGVNFSGVAKDANIIAIQVFRRKTGESCTNFGVSSPCLLSARSDQIAALEHVLDLSDDRNIAAINLSLGGGSFTQTCDDENPAYTDVVRELQSRGIATVISSGNDSSEDSLSFPACISRAVSVGATTLQDQVASFSNSASFLDLLAPGAGNTSAFGLQSSVPNDTFGFKRGTSMAAPHVTGAFAVLKSKVPSATVSELQSLLRSTGVAVTDTRNDITKRRINIGAAHSALCVAQLTPAVVFVSRFGGPVTVSVRGTSDGCPWRARSSVSWISVSAPTQPVSGNGAVLLNVLPNTLNFFPPIIPLVRTGTVTIGGRTVTIVQTN